MIRLMQQLWPRGKYRLKAYRLGYTEGYDAAWENLERLTEEAARASRIESFNRGYEEGRRSGLVEGFNEGKLKGLAKRSHYTTLMLPSEEDD